MNMDMFGGGDVSKTKKSIGVLGTEDYDITKATITVDKVFKYVFSLKVVLVNFIIDLIGDDLNLTKEEFYKCLDETQDPSKPQVTMNGQEFGGLGDKHTIRDILFDVKLPEGKARFSSIRIKINLEMERKTDPHYDIMKRAHYYAAQHITKSVGEGGNYNEVEKVYTIWVCGTSQITGNSEYARQDPLTQGNGDIVHKYNMTRQSTDGRYDYHSRADLIELIFIELPVLKKCVKQGDGKYSDLISDFAEIFKAGMFTQHNYESLKSPVQTCITDNVREYEVTLAMEEMEMDIQDLLEQAEAKAEQAEVKAEQEKVKAEVLRMYFIDKIVIEDIAKKLDLDLESVKSILGL